MMAPKTMAMTTSSIIRSCDWPIPRVVSMSSISYMYHRPAKPARRAVPSVSKFPCLPTRRGGDGPSPHRGIQGCGDGAVAHFVERADKVADKVRLLERGGD